LIVGFLYEVFTVIKFFFGLGALLSLIGIGLVCLWFALRIVVRYALRRQPVDRYVPLRQVFLEVESA
jgi:hypothetical protein